jgi:hypothetical protein
MMLVYGGGPFFGPYLRQKPVFSFSHQWTKLFVNGGLDGLAEAVQASTAQDVNGSFKFTLGPDPLIEAD